jgi:hypothetical protein
MISLSEVRFQFHGEGVDEADRAPTAKVNMSASVRPVWWTNLRDRWATGQMARRQRAVA